MNKQAINVVISSIVPTYLPTSLFKDFFTIPRPTGFLNNTACDGGPGTRVVTDTATLLSIAAGMLTGNGTAPADNNPQLNISGNITRAAGVCGQVIFRHHITPWLVALGTWPAGFMAAAFANSHYVLSARTMSAIQPTYLTIISDRAGGATQAVQMADADVWHDVLIRLRGTGAAYYLNRGVGYRLFYVENVSTATPLWFGLRAASANVANFDVDKMELKLTNWIQPTLVSDSFNRANGALGGSTTDGAGCEEVGGNGYPWSDISGVSSIATAAAKFSSLAGGLGITLVNALKTSVYIQVQITRNAGNVGVVFNYTDVNNYCLAYYDGTNLKMDRVAAGLTTNLISLVTAYLASGWLSVSVNETRAAIQYNGNGSFSTGDFSLCAATTLPINGTQCGLYSTDTGNTFVNFCVFDSFPTVPYTYMTLPGWTAFGDSLTDQNGSGALYRELTLKGYPYCVRDYGQGGQQTTQGLLRYAQNVLGNTDKYVSIQMGINDLWSVGYPAGAATVEVNLQSMFTQAKAAGKTVISVNLFPCKGATAYTTTVEQNLQAINAWLADPVAGAQNVDYRVNAHDLLVDPLVPLTLLPAYDSGSHLHLTPQGYDVVAQAVTKAVFGV